MTVAFGPFGRLSLYSEGDSCKSPAPTYLDDRQALLARQHSPLFRRNRAKPGAKPGRNRDSLNSLGGEASRKTL